MPYSLVILITPIFNTTEKVDQGPDRISQKQILKFQLELTSSWNWSALSDLGSGIPMLIFG